MTLSLTKAYMRGDYEKDLEVSINTNLSSISSNLTTILTAVSTFSGNVTTLSANITTLSGNITSLNDFVAVTVSTAVFTLDVTTHRNFTITNTETSAKTLKIVNVPTAADTMLSLNVKLTFSATATFTYTGTITWGTISGDSTAPNVTAAGSLILNLKSFDAGTTWWGTYAGMY